MSAPAETPHVKNPKKVRAGQIAMRARWGEPRILRLDELTPEQRRVVLALVEATKPVPDAESA